MSQIPLHNSKSKEYGYDLVKIWVAQLLSVPSIWKKTFCADKHKIIDTNLHEYVDLMSSEYLLSPVPHDSLIEFIESKSIDDVFQENNVFKRLKKSTSCFEVNETELKLVTFLYYIYENITLRSALSELREIDINIYTSFLTKFICSDKKSIEKLYYNDSILFQPDLLGLCSKISGFNFTDGIEISDYFYAILSDKNSKSNMLENYFFNHSKKPKLELNDYSDIIDDINIIVLLIKNALQNKQPGINILIYGKHDTGKSELAILLGSIIEASLMLVPIKKPKRDYILDSDDRFERYKMIQNKVKKDNSIVVFDEVDALLSLGWYGEDFKKLYKSNKQSIISMLESNQKPAIWICKNIKKVNSAIKDRFTYIVHLDKPKIHKREIFIDKYMSELNLKDKLKRQVIKNHDISPVIIESTAFIGRQAKEAGIEPESVITRSINIRLQANDVSKIMSKEDSSILSWQPEYLNTDVDTSSLIIQLQHVNDMRICLIGPPGTGKTAWAKEVSKKINKTANIIQSSDILSPYFGETEQNIAKVFNEAEKNEAVLILDEVDSYLNNRDSARNSWEVSHVNQFLTSMENYNGILVASTNLIDRLDIASMRRFDLCIKFNYMTPSAIVTIFYDLARWHGIKIDLDNDSYFSDLKKITYATPGDFAALARSLRFTPKKLSGYELYEKLINSIDYKKFKTSIGFT